MGEDAGKCMTHDLWASLNTKMIEYLDSISLKKLVDDQLAKGCVDRRGAGQARHLVAAGGQADQGHRAEFGVSPSAARLPSKPPDPHRETP
jgi:hypothetical protein